jgi:acetolactate synthase-1/2/3 large subunit
MNLQELQTIVHHGLDIKLFWINNDGYHSIKQTQNALFRGRERGLCGADRTSGISFPDAGRIAAAYRLPFVRIDALAGLEEGLACALGTEGPLLCEVVTDPDEEFVPKLQSKLLEDGTFETPSLEDMYPFLGAEEMRQNRFPDS